MNIDLNRNNISSLPLTSYQVGENRYSTKKILFVADALESYGGVEYRLHNIAKVLPRDQWEVFFLTEKNRCSQLTSWRNFTLKFRAENLGQCLLDIVWTHNIDVVEFQFKYSRYLRFINIKKLRQSCVVGCTVHGYDKAISRRLLTKMDYCIIISKSLLQQRYKNLPRKWFTIIHNSILPGPRLWRFCNQNKALHISRISDEYENRISGFIDFCCLQNISVEIAGSVDSKESKQLVERLKRKYVIPDSAFIGKIDTLSHLRKNTNRYLFIAGCGNVVLEAGSVGFPVLITSSTSTASPAFVTPDNIAHFRDTNFTIRKVKIIPRNPLLLKLSSSMEYISKFLHKFIKENRNLEIEIKKYQEVLDSFLTEKTSTQEITNTDTVQRNCNNS